MRWLALSMAMLFVASTAAAAEPTVEERALALTLFKRGRDAMDAGDLEAA